MMDAVRLQAKSFIFSMYSEGQLSNLGRPPPKVSKSNPIVAIRRCGCYNVMNGICSSTAFVLQDSRKKRFTFLFSKTSTGGSTTTFFFRPKSLVQSFASNFGKNGKIFCWPMLE